MIQFHLPGTAMSQNALNVLVNNVQLSPHFTDVNIASIESTGENTQGVNFDMRAVINLEEE